MEFYLVKPNIDPDYPLEPPIGRSGRPERARQAYSITAVNEFEELFDDIYRFSEAQGLEIDTLNHEDGTAQMEINLRHGDPVELADQVFLFKRTIREAALRHKMYATFMAKPIATEPGSAMHIHHSVSDADDRPQHLRRPRRQRARSALPELSSPACRPICRSVMCMLAPYVNSYRRLVRNTSAPINVRWGFDNRTVGLRVPLSDPANRRVENRVPSSDANPYLAIAASLACGYLGLVKGCSRTGRSKAPARIRQFALPRSILDAVRLLGDHAGAGGDFRRDLRAHLPRHQGDRIRDVHGRDQPMGARISAARASEAALSRWRARFPPSFFRLAAGDVAANTRRSKARAAPMSASSAAASPACPRRCISPRPAPTSCSIEANSDRERRVGAERRADPFRPPPRRDLAGEEIRLRARQNSLGHGEEAKALLRALIIRYAIACDLRAGVIETLHKQSLLPDAAELVEALRERFGYDQASLLDRAETIAALGSERFFGGIDDRGGGHLDPYRFSLGLARAAARHGAAIHENTPARRRSDTARS